MNDEILYKLWAKSKPPHALICHLLDAAAVALALVPRFGVVSPLSPEWLAYLVALHDIGKADRLFQAKDHALAEPLRARGLELPGREETIGFRHEARSAEWVFAHLCDVHGWDCDAATVAQLAIKGHHADFRVDTPQEADRTIAVWNPLRDRLASLVWEALSPHELIVSSWNDASAAGMRLSGMIVLSDWIASNQELLGYEDLPKPDSVRWTPSSYLSAARVRAERVVRSLGLSLDPRSKDGQIPMFNEVWPFEPRPLQNTIAKGFADGRLLPGLAIIEAPMGIGKTEAGIYLAECWNRALGTHGLYVALPTQATSNQMHSRYSDFVRRNHPEDIGPRLVHGMAWLVDEYEPERSPEIDSIVLADAQLAREWFASSKRALIAPHGVGTIDQSLMAALNVRHGFLRFLGLTRKVLIVDEVHACDDYMNVILQRMLRWCAILQVPVILMSATLSASQRRLLCAAYAGFEPEELDDAPFDKAASYPLVTSCSLRTPSRIDLLSMNESVGDRRRVQLERIAGIMNDPDAIASLAADRVRRGGCACVFMNTVSGAQAVYRVLQEREWVSGCPKLMLFHARFTASRRQEIEKEVIQLFGKDSGERPERAIVVCTQVLEQSIDVDFDVMISQIAPVDLLLQRMGRLWRHDRPLAERWGHSHQLVVLTPEPGVHPDFGTTERVYFREWLLRTLALVWESDFIELPRDFRRLIETCYGADADVPDGIATEDLMKAIADRLAEIHKAEQDAERHLVPEPRPGTFTYADMQRAADEAEDGEASTYFRASTRRGDDSVSALLLDDPSDVELARQEEWPGRRHARRLYENFVRLPRWWFQNLEAAEGYDPIVYGSGWLRNLLIIPIRKQRWDGLRKTTNNGLQPVSIFNSSADGVSMRQGGVL